MSCWVVTRPRRHFADGLLRKWRNRSQMHIKWIPLLSSCAALRRLLRSVAFGLPGQGEYQVYIRWTHGEFPTFPREVTGEKSVLIPQIMVRKTMNIVLIVQTTVSTGGNIFAGTSTIVSAAEKIVLIMENIFSTSENIVGVSPTVVGESLTVVREFSTIVGVF
jgi:hypothetical protein